MTTVLALACATVVIGCDGAGPAGKPDADPPVALVGRAVLPAETYAPGPVSGTGYTGAPNGISFPLPSQPVAGVSSIIDGRRPGEYLAMPDNGFGNKNNSKDFLIRAYYVRPEFKTATGGRGTVTVGEHVSFRDPNGVIGFTIVNDETPDRLLTGADVDTESLQRDRNGDLWVGDEFGPWILHFGSDGVLLDAPFSNADVRSATNPTRDGQPVTQPNSRGFEALAISPDGNYLYAALEGARIGDPDQSRRRIYEFSIGDKTFTGRTWPFETSRPGYSVADLAALDGHRLAFIERDDGSGLDARFRRVALVDLRRVDSDGFLRPRTLVDLTAIPDPDLISLPPIHPGDVGLGNPFLVASESVEALHPLGESRLLIACDNNFPKSGRNPERADDTEFVVVKVAGMEG